MLSSLLFFRRFGVGEHNLALVFFAVHILNACSHLGAASLTVASVLSTRWYSPIFRQVCS